MPATAPFPVAPAVGGVQTVRRLITYLLFAATVSIAANGLGSLLDRLFTAYRVDVIHDNDGLATALASALIAGPLAGLLWWLMWRDVAMARDRTSVLWPVYLVVMATVALLIATFSLFGWAAEAIAYGWQPFGLATGIVWSLVWLWHSWMWLHPSKAPVRLPGAAPALASLIGLSFAVGGTIFAVGRLMDAAIDTFTAAVVVSDSLGRLVLQSLVWAVGGALVWWWHWFRVGVRSFPYTFAHVLLVFIAGVASYAVVAGGLMLALRTLLELATGVQRPLAVVLDPFSLAVASAAIGALVLVYHRRIVASQPSAVRSANGLASAGVSLAFAASGVGVTLNALLASATDPLIAGDIRVLLLGGISALIVGGVFWWLTWRPRGASNSERAAMPGRRVYLVIIFGVSALVALITLLVIGFQLFSFLLDGESGESFVERSRQALGLLAATMLVAAYHFAVWRNDRGSDGETTTVQRISKVTLVSSKPSAELLDAIRTSTGARVAVLQRAERALGEPDVATVIAALDGIEWPHVLVVTEAEGSLAVILLAT